MKKLILLSCLIPSIAFGWGELTYPMIKNDSQSNVKWHGANGADSVDDTAAFSKAAKNTPSANNIVGVEGSAIPRAPMSVVYVPSGNYKLTSEVDTGGKEITWILDQAATVDGYAFLNGKVLRQGQRQADAHHGTTDYATGYSIRNNGSLEDGAEVLGITNPNQLATYTDRDTVGLYVDNASPPATVDVATATYTANTVTITAPSAEVLRKYRRGMIVDTKHSPKWSGIVSAWNADGSVLTVTAWYKVGDGGVASTPTNGTGCVLNAFTKVWAHNSNVFLTAGGHAEGATGFELGMFNSRADSSADYADADNRAWGFDSVNLGTYKGQAAFISRGAWRVGYLARPGADVGFKSTSNTYAFTASDGNDTTFYSVDSLANINVGNPSVAGTREFSFLSGALNSDHDTKITASGGTATPGQGRFDYIAAKHVFNGFHLVGTQDVALTSLGGSLAEISSPNPGLQTLHITGNTISPAILTFAKDRVGAVVQNGDSLGEFRFEGNTGGGYQRFAAITAETDGALGTDDAPGKLIFKTSSDASATPIERLRINAVGETKLSGAFFVNTSSATSSSAGGAPVEIASATAPNLQTIKFANSSVTPAIFTFVKERADGTAIQNGDSLGEFRFEGNTGSGYQRFVAITAETDGALGTNDAPGRLLFKTSADASATPVERLRINAKGEIIPAALVNAADDTAAAAAGVSVGAFYRNGSVLMVRVI